MNICVILFFMSVIPSLIFRQRTKDKGGEHTLRHTQNSMV